MEKKRVVIVNEGVWGEVTKGKYDLFVGSIKGLLERTKKKDDDSGEEENRAESVIVAESTEEAMKRVRMNNVDILIFNSRSMIPKARKIKEKYPRLKVVVLTGLIPDDEIILFDKRWIVVSGDLNIFKTIIFD